MKEDWIEELHTKYKHLFDTYEDEETERSYYAKGQVLRGVECNSGWKWAIIKFLESLEWLTENRRMIPNPDYNKDEKQKGVDPYIEGPKLEIKIFQIKSKFAEMRCYMTSYPDRIEGDIQNAIGKLEARTQLTCELCGHIGLDVNRSNAKWVVNICSNCYSKKSKNANS